MENKESVVNFINACNELVDGKFILADIKISKILRTISESNDIYNLIAESMINYDFDKEFNKAVVKDSAGLEKFQLPEEAEKIIPLVFCLLVEIDSKRINFNDFIKAQFPLANNQNEEYLAFAKNIVIPFRDAIANFFNIDVKSIASDPEEKELNNIIDEKIKEHIKEEESTKESEEMENNEQQPVEKTVIIKTTLEPVYGANDPISNAILQQEKQRQQDEEAELLFNRILRIVRILDDKTYYVRNPLKKSNISLIVDALYEACQLQNVKIIVALVMALNNFAGNERSMKGEIRELNTICYDFYE